VVAAMIMHRVRGTYLLVGAMFCYMVSGILGATQPPGTIYWAMSFPAMCTSHEGVNLGIGVIGADLSNVVGNMFATSNVSKEYQSIAVAIVVTILALSNTIGQSISSSLITSRPTYPFLMLDVGGNALTGDVPEDQLVKGFHASFWFGFGASFVALLISMTLRVGTRGHKGETDLRDVAMISDNGETSGVSTGNDIEVEVIQRTGLPRKE
jgi:hypothetical protein